MSAHGDNTGGNGEQHNGDDDKFQQVQEDRAEGLNILLGKINTVGDDHENNAGYDTDAQTHEDPKCKRELLFVQLDLSFLKHTNNFFNYVCHW